MGRNDKHLLFRARTLLQAAFIFVCSVVPLLNTSGAQEAYPPTVRQEKGTEWEVNGSVRSPIGLPVPGAEFHLEYSSYYRPMWQSRSRIISKGKTNAVGNFKVSFRPSYCVVANSPKFAPTAVGAPEGSEIKIQLDPGRSVSGQVKLPNGDPAKDISVRPVMFLYRLKKHELAEIQASELAIHPRVRYRPLGFPDSGEPWAVKTDKSGGFTIDRVPTDCRVAIAFESPGYQSQAVWVKTSDDNDENLHPQFELKSDGFEIALKPSFVLKLSGRNEVTGELEKISRIMVQAHFVKPEDVNPANPNVYVVDYAAAVDVQTSLQPMPRGGDIWVEPENDELMGFRFRLDQIGTEGELEKIIPFNSGKLVKGTVVNIVDRDPIPDAQIQWSGADKKNWTKEGDFPKLTIQTDKNGKYSIAVPDTDGTLAIIGEVDGCRTVNSWQWVHNPLLADSKFSRPLKKAELDTAGKIDFELEPASKIRFLAVGSDGSPEPYAIITAKAANASRNSFPGPLAFRRETLTSDADGKVELDDWHSHAGLVAQARELLDAPDAKKQPELIKRALLSGYPTIVEAFSSSGLLQGSATIPLPEPGNNDPIEVKINLTESAAILGKVVDQDGQPIGDLDVSLSRSTGRFSGGSQNWKTKTRADGFFKATGLLPANDYLLILGNNDVTPVGAELNRLQLNTKDDLLPGKTFEIAVIECFDFRALGGNLPELDIKGLGQPEALKTITTYVQQQLAKIPEEDPRFRSRSSQDPIPVFLEKLAALIIPKLKEAGNLNAGSESELKELTAIGTLFLPPSIKLNFSGERRVRRYVSDRLLEQFSEHPDAQPALIAIVGNDGRNGYSNRWQQLFERSKYLPTKQKAGLKTALGLAANVGDNTAARSSKAEFESEFLLLEKHLVKMGELAKPKNKTDVDAFQVQVNEFRKEYQGRYDFNEKNNVPESYRYNAERLRLLFDRMDQFVDEIRK